MKRLLFFAFAALAAASGVGGTASAPSFAVDFRDATLFAQPPGREWHVSDDGTAAWNDAVKGMPSFTIKTDLAQTSRPFELTFDVRGYELADPGHHWGLAFRNARGDRLFTWSQGNCGLIFQTRTPKGTMLEDGNGGRPLAKRGKPGDGEADLPWTTFRLTCDDEGYCAQLGADVCYRGETRMLGVTNVWFYGYNESVAYRNIRITPLPPPKADVAEAPTFRKAGDAAGAWTVTNAVSAAVGGFSCWMRPMKSVRHLAFETQDGREVAAFSLYSYPGHDRARVRLTFGAAGEDTHMRVVESLARRTDEWYHVAFTWNEKGRGRLYVNGLPFTVTQADSADVSVTGNEMDAVSRVVAQGGAIRDLTLWRRTLSAREIIDDYRRRMPVDCIAVDSLLPAHEAFPPAFRLAPGGFYTRPNPVEGDVLKSAVVTVATRIDRVLPVCADRSAPGVATGYRFEPVPGSETTPVLLALTNAVELMGAAVALDPGEYRLAVSITPRGAADAHVRHLLFTVAPRLDTSSAPRTKDDLARGRLLWEKTLGEPYREAGTNRVDRFFFEVPFPTEALERPCLLEVEWPDDKPRAMGLYMYERLDNSCRDHLQQGLVAGGELPSSGAMQTTRYLFWPATTNYLFEARTMIANRPAAVRALRVYAIDGPLPKLAIHRPEGLPSRTFGYCDEDQTFDNNLTTAQMNRPTAEVLSRLADYMNYTGQDAFYLSATRYSTLNAGWARANEALVFPRRPGEWRGLVRALARCGVQAVPQNLFANDPTIARLGQIEGRDRENGFALADNDGVLRRDGVIGRAPMNHTNEAAVARFLSLFTDFYRDLSVRGVSRTLLSFDGDIASPLAWRGWDYGETNAPNALAERCAPVTRNLRRYVEELTADNPSLRVMALLSSDRVEQAMRGLDVEALAKIPNLDLAVIRSATAPWWPAFRGETRTPAEGLEKAYGAATRADLARLRRASGGAIPVVCSWPYYYESFAKLPEAWRKKYGNYFQDADMKPWGRHFLRELAFCLAETDMLNFAIGMQPLATIGVEAETREWTQAYRALPALPFADVAMGDVVVRTCETKNGAYWYFVNTTCAPRTVDAPVAGLFDLSSDAPLDGRRVDLKPYQLRSFLVRKEVKRK